VTEKSSIPPARLVQSARGQVPSEKPSLESELATLLRAEHPDPFSLLGPHEVERGGARRIVIRVLQPHAESVAVVIGNEEIPAERVNAEGLFEALLPAGTRPSARDVISPQAPLTGDLGGPLSYRLRIRWPDGNATERPDPYAFPAVMTEFDLHLLAEGTHYQSYEKLGAHIVEVEGVRGVQFAVWAPNALRVSVVGDFNGWDGRVNPMRSRGGTGIWELFVPGLGSGEIYKYEIRSRLGDLPFLKSDPYAFEAELRPKSGSVVASLEDYRWEDHDWIRARAERDWLVQPMSVYEVHLGSWRRVAEDGNRWLSYRELAERLIPYVKDMGYTHVELLPVMEHPFDGSWGYQTVGYFAATRRFGTPADFMYFVDRCHQAGLGVILDWTPAHFPADAHGLAEFDGTHLYEHADPRQGRHPDWGTLVFNYGRAEVQNFLLSNALFWLNVYHIDALRVDAVASMLYLDYSRRAGEWIPNEFGGRENLAAIAFLKHMNETVRARCPGVLMIAEESTSWPAVSRPVSDGGLGFNLKWNMGWMNDTLRYFELDPVYRKYHHGELTFSMLYAFNENFVLPLSHDEVVHGKRSLLNKMPGDLWQQFANLRLLYAYMFAHPGKKLLFMGAEFGQRSEWSADRELEWELLQYPEHRGLHRLVTDLNGLYRRETALHEVDFAWQGFEWVECNDADAGVLAFARHARQASEALLIVVSFTPAVRENYRVGVPEPGRYREIFNSDAEIYGGSNVGNLGEVAAEPVPWMGRPYSIVLRLSPLGVAFFKRQSD
jgi:1,4-alpha-glucan branching enzyme